MSSMGSGHQHRRPVGMWLAENEGAKFWLNVLTELKNRGLLLKGFPDAINAVYPEARIPAVHRTYGAQQPAVRLLTERLQGL